MTDFGAFLIKQEDQLQETADDTAKRAKIAATCRIVFSNPNYPYSSSHQMSSLIKLRISGAMTYGNAKIILGMQFSFLKSYQDILFFLNGIHGGYWRFYHLYIYIQKDDHAASDTTGYTFVEYNKICRTLLDVFCCFNFCNKSNVDISYGLFCRHLK